MYTSKKMSTPKELLELIARTPFREGKGPDILDFVLDGNLESARASDSKMVNAIGRIFP